MEITSKLITLDDMEILREPLEKLHKHHNEKSVYFSGSYPKQSFEERVKEYKEKEKKGEYRIEVLTDEKQLVVGFCISYKEKENGHINVLFVEQQCRKHGLGARLIKSAIEWFEQNGIKDIELTVVYGNDAVEFYKKMGFYPRSTIMTTRP